MTNIKSDDKPEYLVEPIKATNKGLDKRKEDQLINEAIAILDSRIKTKNYLSSPSDVKKFLRLKFQEYKHEIFGMICLDNRHNVLDFSILFHGTINGAAVYPREVVKHCLKLNASAVIFAHNHPSGNSEPSQNDKALNERLTKALELIEIRVLDHLIVGEGVPTSFAERGLI